jgi:hypothetical protein
VRDGKRRKCPERRLSALAFSIPSARPRDGPNGSPGTTRRPCTIAGSSYATFSAT